MNVQPRQFTYTLAQDQCVPHRLFKNSTQVLRIIMHMLLRGDFANVEKKHPNVLLH
jgi:hypothetical protein